MAELDDDQRKRIRKGDFAYVDADGEGHLPIHDEAHARNAMARFNQTKFESVEAKEKARRKILSAARRFGIDVSEESNVAKPARDLKPARTKSGARGGKKKIDKDA